MWFRRVNRLQENEDASLDHLTSVEPYIASQQQFSQFAHENASIDKFNTSDEQTFSAGDINFQDSTLNATADDIIIISVLAKPNHHFASYDLFQAISATGMQFGDMDIFHYYQPTEKGQQILFSLASATKPGKFDLDHMGDFSCVGLSLFMDKKSVSNPQKVFLKMLEKAEQLADDLDGELRAGPKRLPWNEHILQHYLSTM